MTTTVIKNVESIQHIRKKAAAAHQSIGFVPTMGNLHPGHASLLHRSHAENHITLLSIFVNPTQFDSPDDFRIYPRTMAQDEKIAQESGVDYIFLPNEALLYPNGYRYRISEKEQSACLEGIYRPGHFEGMLTVVMKLLQIIQPTHAYFGEKDYQQYELIKGLVEDFFLETQIIACPTIREKTGLAFSSRNNLLAPARREFASHLYRGLQSTQNDAHVTAELTALGFTVEYIATQHNRRYGAAWLDGVRLIDNISYTGYTSYVDTANNSASVSSNGKIGAKEAVRI